MYLLNLLLKLLSHGLLAKSKPSMAALFRPASKLFIFHLESFFLLLFTSQKNVERKEMFCEAKANYLLAELAHGNVPVTS